MHTHWHGLRPGSFHSRGQRGTWRGTAGDRCRTAAETAAGYRGGANHRISSPGDRRAAARTPGGYRLRGLFRRQRILFRCGGAAAAAGRYGGAGAARDLQRADLGIGAGGAMAGLEPLLGPWGILRSGAGSYAGEKDVFSDLRRGYTRKALHGIDRSGTGRTERFGGRKSGKCPDAYLAGHGAGLRPEELCAPECDAGRGCTPIRPAHAGDPG